VRGTVFEFDAVNLTVEEGTVVFSGADRTGVYVRAGESCYPDPVSGKAAAPVETAAAQAPQPPAGAGMAGTGEGGFFPGLPGAPPEVIPGPVSQAPVSVGVRWQE
jgi:hypothetical protein